MSYHIDNPGGGDCGFYALSIGLIDIIQKEHQATGKSLTFNRWVHEGLVGVSLDNFLDVDLEQLSQSPRQYERKLLSTLQMSLRNSAAQASKEDLLVKIQEEALSQERLTKVESSAVFGKFMELVKTYLQGTPSRRQLKDLGHFNELALSPEVNQLAAQTAESLKPKLKGKSFQNYQKIENAHVKQVLLQDIMSHGTVNPRSVLLKGTDAIKEQGHWAAHSDLKEVAARLDVNLYINGKINGALAPDKATVILNNHGNAHWTTEVESLRPKRKADSELSDKPKTKRGATGSASNPRPDASTVERRSSKRIKLSAIPDDSISEQAEQIIQTTVSSQILTGKRELYKQHLKELMHASLKLGLFADVANKIDVNAIDEAEAAVDIKGERESDESFAARLQEAEIRRSGLKS